MPRFWLAFSAFFVVLSLRPFVHVAGMRALFMLSEGRTLPIAWLDEACQSRDSFLRHGCIRYVVIDKRRASSDRQRLVQSGCGATSRTA